MPYHWTGAKVSCGSGISYKEYIFIFHQVQSLLSSLLFLLGYLNPTSLVWLYNLLGHILHTLLTFYVQNLLHFWYLENLLLDLKTGRVLLKMYVKSITLYFCVFEIWSVLRRVLYSICSVYHLERDYLLNSKCNKWGKPIDHSGMT